MGKYFTVFCLVFAGLFSNVNAASVWVADAEILEVEFYGNQFTLILNKEHTAKACGHPGNVVAMNTASEPGKTHYSFFLAAYMAKKKVSINVTDSVCSGDRPTIAVIRG